MSTASDVTTVRAAVQIDVPVEHAFTTFHAHFDRIKPRGYTLLDSEVAESVFEPRVGGRVYDRGVDGSECHWGRVVAFEPPYRFVLRWGISPGWELEQDPDRCSEVEVTFTADGPGRTLVRLEHRHLDRHGGGWQALRDQLAGEYGWAVFLGRLSEAVATV